MTCGISDIEWLDYLDQALSLRQRQKIDGHLQTCASCRSEFEALREVDQRLRIECGLARQSMGISEESQVSAGERILAAIREGAPRAAHERLWRVRWVLALLCGSNTAGRIIAAAERQAEELSTVSYSPAPVSVNRGSTGLGELTDDKKRSSVLQGEQRWLLFLRRLSFLTTEVCGSYAGELIWAVGQ